MEKRKPLGLEVIFCMGGYNKKSCSSFYCFNPETGNWKCLGDMSQANSGSGCAFVGMCSKLSKICCFYHYIIQYNFKKINQPNLLFL